MLECIELSSMVDFSMGAIDLHTHTHIHTHTHKLTHTHTYTHAHTYAHTRTHTHTHTHIHTYTVEGALVYNPREEDFTSVGKSVQLLY